MVSYLAAEGAGILGVLRDFDLLDHLTQRGTITGTVLSDDSDLLSALGLESKGKKWDDMRIGLSTHIT